VHLPEPLVFERSLILVAIAMVAACGSSSSPAASPAAPTPSGPAPAAPAAEPSTITIASTGFSPLEVTVPVGARVTFVNGDRVAYDISSGLDHASRECPEIDVVGFLLPGQSRETSAFDQPKTCRFHEHGHLGIAAYQGRIVVR
jgi:plastocyanin